MATFRICVQKQRNDGYWPVYIRVIHERTSAFIRTEKFVDNKGLSGREVKDPFVLKMCSIKITEYIKRLNLIDTSNMTAKDIVDFLSQDDKDVSFSDFARAYKLNMEKEGMKRNARNYELAYQHLERYAGTNQLVFSRMTSRFIEGWIKSLEKTARAKEMYPVCIRQIFKEALQTYNDYDNGIIKIKTNPWGKIKIPTADTPEKKAITPDKIRDFFSAVLPKSDRVISNAEIARDVAMMVMCLAGMNTVDIYYLEKGRLKDGEIICYNRRKTMKFRSDKSYMEMRIPDIIKPLFEKYKSSNDSKYLLDFSERFKDEDSFNANINAGIKKVCDSMGIPKEDQYCVYTFRHSWATIARSDLRAPLDDVAFAMNHASAHKITDIYIRPDFSSAFELNQKVVDFIFFGVKVDLNEGKPEKTSEENRGHTSKYDMINAGIYFKGEKLYELCDTGFSNLKEVVKELMKHIPSHIPTGCKMQIKIQNKDTGKLTCYERENRPGD